MFKVYGMATCSWCDNARDLLERHNIPYKYLELDSDITREEFKILFPSATTVPQITFNDKYIGDFAGLETYISGIIKIRKMIIDALLNVEPLSFSYKKKDGTIRKTTGTLYSDLIPVNQLPSNKNTKENNFNIRYFDLEKMGWRSFNTQNYIGEV